jgi:hypothetical protein
MVREDLTENRSSTFLSFSSFWHRFFRSYSLANILGYPVLLYVFKRASYLPTGGPVRNTRALRMLMRDGGADPNVLVQGKPLLIIFCEHGATKVR